MADGSSTPPLHCECGAELTGPEFTNPPEINMGKLEKQKLLMYFRTCLECESITVTNVVDAS